MLTPIQTFSGHGRYSAILARRFARLVSTWYVCRGVSAMVSKTPAMNSTGTSS